MKNVTLYEVVDKKLVLFEVQPFTFSAGEPHINWPEDIQGRHFVIYVTGGDLGDLCAAIVISDIICVNSTLDLYVPYLPGSRMDRITETQPFTLYVVADILSKRFSRIYTLDVHSNKASYLIPNLINLEIMPDLSQFPADDTTIIAPDAGALGRAAQVAQHYGMRSISAHKVRDPDNNYQVTEYTCPKVTTKYGIVIDDICDGGRTFTELAKILDHDNLYLFITHGIYSKGTQELLNHYRMISTTDSFHATEDNHTCISILEEVL